MKFTYRLGLMTLSTMIIACGGKNVTSENEQDLNPEILFLADDSEKTDIETQTEEAFSSISNDLGLDSSLGLMLTASLESDTSVERNCESATEAGGTTTVSISREHSRSFVKGNGNSGQSIIGINMNRTWTKDGEIVPCNDNQTHIALALSDFDGVKLETKLLNRGFTRTLSKKDVDGNLINYVHSRDTSGTRNISWNSVTELEGVITHSKTVSMDLKTLVTKPQKEGEVDPNQLEFSIKTGSSAKDEADSDGSLVVSVSFDSNKKWLNKTIETGTTVGTSPEKTITLSFDMVKFERDFDCDPVSGLISGSIVSEKDGEPITLEFILNYTNDEFTLNGETFERPDIEICEFTAAKRTVKKVIKAKQKLRQRAAIAYKSIL
ncbi:MAG: hypothetical protein AB8G05_10435 [Oligoflexales bacterium]